MPQRVSSRLSLKGFIILTLLLVGLAPLAASVVVNMPMVVGKLQQLGELERLNELEQQVTALGRSMEHRKENLRTINALPGTADLFSDPADLLLDPKNIKQRMGAMFNRWLSPEAGVEAVFMVNADGAPVANWGVNGSAGMRQRAIGNFPEAHVVAGWLAESKSIPLGTVYVAGVEQDFLDNGSKHSHFAHIILGIPGVNSAGAYGGAILMKISMAPFLEELAYDFVVTGAGQLLQRYEPDHHHGGAGNHAHGEIVFGDEFAELLTVADDRKHLILTALDGRRVAFVKIIDDLHREHAVWLAHAMHPGDLAVWTRNFQGRLALILVFLMGLVFVLAMVFAGRAEKMCQQLVGGLNRLISHKEPLRLGWSFPVEVKELGHELEVLGQSLISSDETLRQKERFLKGIFDGIQDGISVQDCEYTILETNATLEQWYPDKLPLEGRKCYEVYHDRPTPCEFCPVREVLDQGVLHRCEMAGQATGDVRTWLEVFAYPVRNEQGEIIQVVELIRDISAKKKAEAERDNLANQLIFAQKMEAVGTLAGGVAHDFNNILSAINGYAEMCLMKMEEDNPLWPKIKTILDSGQRASRLTQQLLAFSRKQIIHPQDIDVDQSLAGIRKMLARILGEDIDINMVIGPDLWHIHADQTQFEQVLINLAVNARDAMPRGGKLTFEAKNIVLDQTYVERHYEILPGEYVLLAISDNGEGMDKETMAKIFEPFFTTKDLGKGTGLGLATVYGIIKQSSGEILVYSEPGQGTTFKIYLPRHQEVSPTPAAMAEPEDLATGSETVLLVEDDEVVRTMTVEILTSLGYSVLEAADGEEALQTCKRYHGRIGLLFTDVVMPKMNGAELAAKVVKLRPDIKVLFMSGYTDDAVVRHGILQGDVHFVQKPVTPKILAKTLRQVLGTSPTET